MGLLMQCSCGRGLTTAPVHDTVASEHWARLSADTEMLLTAPRCISSLPCPARSRAQWTKDLLGAPARTSPMAACVEAIEPRPTRTGAQYMIDVVAVIALGGSENNDKIGQRQR